MVNYEPDALTVPIGIWFASWQIIRYLIVILKPKSSPLSLGEIYGWFRAYFHYSVPIAVRPAISQCF